MTTAQLLKQISLLHKRMKSSHRQQKSYLSDHILIVCRIYLSDRFMRLSNSGESLELDVAVTFFFSFLDLDSRLLLSDLGFLEVGGVIWAKSSATKHQSLHKSPLFELLQDLPKDANLNKAQVFHQLEVSQEHHPNVRRSPTCTTKDPHQINSITDGNI